MSQQTPEVTKQQTPEEAFAEAAATLAALDKFRIDYLVLEVEMLRAKLAWAEAGKAAIMLSSVRTMDVLIAEYEGAAGDE
jgi:hypothetical protein